MQNVLLLSQMSEHIEYICAKCAQQSETCCSLGTDGSATGEECFPISEAEAERVRLALQRDPSVMERLNELYGTLTPDDVMVEEVNGPVFMKAVRSMFPGESGAVNNAFVPGGTHLRMALPDGRRCVFLSPEGCVLERASRPWFCHMYPFWRVRKSIRCFANDDCLAVRSAGSTPALLELFGMQEEDVRKIHESIRMEWNIDGGVDRG